MKFTVVWVPTAQAQLANWWMQAADRQAVTDSANRIDQELQQDADKKGTPFGPFLALFDDPLSVLYTVDLGDCMVRVIQVRRNKK
jgi:hypothetical protein